MLCCVISFEKEETYLCINVVNQRELRVNTKKNFFMESGMEISDTTMSIVLNSDLAIKNVCGIEPIIDGEYRIFTYSGHSRF